VPCARTAEIPPTIEKEISIMINAIAELQGNIASAFGLLGAAIGVGLIGLKAAEAVGRNPAASGKVLVQAIIGMALAEGLGILALFLAK
jgi:F-type H+-transporting ATPase subunit c